MECAFGAQNHPAVLGKALAERPPSPFDRVD
jgi:hypothetical protein